MTGERNEARRRREDAADWCLRLEDGLESLEEQLALEAWLEADPLNRKAFEQIAAIWDGAGAVADRLQLIDVRTDALEAMRAPRRRWSARLDIGARRLAAIAACFLLFVTVSVTYFLPHSQTYATATGERRVVMLADGSRLSLDAASRVEVDYSEDRRSIRLVEGRAKFDVAKDPRRPFAVTAGDRVVVATGTAFSVELVQRQMRVILYEGSVSVLEDSARNEPPRHVLTAQRRSADQVLRPGTTLVASLDRPVGVVVPVDTLRSLSWEAGQLNFSDEPLMLAAERMNRYSETKLSVEGRAADIRVSGTFNAGDVEGFVDGLQALYPVKVNRAGRTISLGPEAGS